MLGIGGMIVAFPYFTPVAHYRGIIDAVGLYFVTADYLKDPKLFKRQEKPICSMVAHMLIKMAERASPSPLMKGAQLFFKKWLIGPINCQNSLYYC